jgi:hypothetical protein
VELRRFAVFYAGFVRGTFFIFEHWKGTIAMTSTAQQAPLAIEFALPVHRLATARPMLKNPDRGLRMETYITLGKPLEAYPQSCECPFEKMLNFIEKYKEESPTIVQLYVYLTNYNEKKLDDLAFIQLEQMLQLLHNNGVRVLLRFTYQNESNPDATWHFVRQHLLQIGRWMKEHHQLVEDSIFAVQAGIVGYWGEAHGNQNFRHQHIGEAFDLLLDIVPQDLYVQVRNIELLTQLSPRHAARVGMHDDYMIGELHGEWNFFLGRDDDAAHAAQAGFWHSINDGEMPWGHATYYDKPGAPPLDSMDALPILRQCLQYSLTTLSLEHNYRESVPGRTFSMYRWRSQQLRAAQLREESLPYHPALLDDQNNINTFEYIRHHLGYLLTITEFVLDGNTLRFTIQNNGFAAPLNFHALSVMIDGEEFAVDSYDRFALASMQAVTYTVQLPQGIAPQSIGIRLARRMGSPIAARFMNDTEFINGVQIMR